ncbi:MAG: MiaB/RimO family radical SAM methylthiotransferase [Gemmatimonadota bacterium]|nr:MAG: MiaB/RimO family radical SAM methylthiotransferase [Gemmatimonadota bacterium]
MTRVYLHTFGCKANQYDTEVVRQALETNGATSVDDPMLADLAIVNSCTVTRVSEAKMRSLVRRLVRRNRRIRTVVMGCAAQLDDGAIAALPGVMRVVGGTDPRPVLRAAGIAGARVDPVLRRFHRGTRAWLKIQDGCDEHCTFCATKLARGASRSRVPQEIVAEARILAERHREIVLTGVHIGSYGRDLAGAASLGSLMELLVSEIPVVRFRLTSIEATEIEVRLTDIMCSEPNRLAPHIHAPLQSGSDRVLRRMGRHWYTALDYRECIERIAARLPRLGLGADIMVGFPAESEEDHAATISLVKDLPFTYLHVFPYSERPGVASHRLGPPAATDVSQSRSLELRALAGRKAREYQAASDGTVADVILLQRTGGRFEGVTGDYLATYLSSDSVPPSRCTATLEVEGDALWAHPLDSLP